MAKKVYSDRFNKTYKTYRKRYFQKKRQFEKLNRKNMRKGVETRYHMREEVMAKSDFLTYYKTYKEELAAEGIKNPNVVQYIVSDQAYIYSRKQFRGMRAYFKDKGSKELGRLEMQSNFSEIDYRTGNVEIDYETMSKEYYYLTRELGMSSTDARKQITKEYYYGSQ